MTGVLHPLALARDSERLTRIAASEDIHRAARGCRITRLTDGPARQLEAVRIERETYDLPPGQPRAARRPMT